MAHNPLKLVFIPTWWLPRSWSRCLTTDAGESFACPVLVSGFWKQCYECLLYFLNSLSNRDNYYLQFGIFPFRIPGRIQREASSCKPKESFPFSELDSLWSMRLPRPTWCFLTVFLILSWACKHKSPIFWFLQEVLLPTSCHPSCLWSLPLPPSLFPL